MIEFDSAWILGAGLAGVLLNSAVFLLANLHHRRKTARALRETQRELQSRLDRLEKELVSAQNEQRERWSEVRKTIARLEFKSGGVSEHTQRSTTFGLDKRHQVCALARQGLAAEEISKKLKLYRGETELLLGLRKYGSGTEKNDARTSLH